MKKIISHIPKSTLGIDTLINRVKTKPPSCGSSKAVEIINSLAEFDLGRFLIKNKGLNGLWTQYVCLHPYPGILVFTLATLVIYSCKYIKFTRKKGMGERQA